MIKYSDFIGYSGIKRDERAMLRINNINAAADDSSSNPLKIIDDIKYNKDYIDYTGYSEDAINGNLDPEFYNVIFHYELLYCMKQCYNADDDMVKRWLNIKSILPLRNDILSIGGVTNVGLQGMAYDHFQTSLFHMIVNCFGIGNKSRVRFFLVCACNGDCELANKILDSAYTSLIDKEQYDSFKFATNHKHVFDSITSSTAFTLGVPNKYVECILAFGNDWEGSNIPCNPIRDFT